MVSRFQSRLSDLAIRHDEYMVKELQSDGFNDNSYHITVDSPQA